MYNKVSERLHLPFEMVNLRDIHIILEMVLNIVMFFQ